MNKYVLIFLIILLCLPGALLFAQEKHLLSGQVTDSLHHPLEFVNITIKDRPDGTITDQNGQFSFETQTPLPFTLITSYIGYTSREIEIRTMANLKNISIVLESKQEVIDQVEVTGEIKDQSFTKIDPKLIKALPDASGGNIEGLVKSQMGVASNNELSSQYRVRGGNYDENLV